jgi:hypothetical protein
MPEEWRLITGWPYEVSNLGHVRTIDRMVTQKSRTGRIISFFKRGRALKLGTDKNGYLIFKLCEHGIRKSVRVQRLVCEAFHGMPPSTEHEAAHNNGVRTDNRADNLRWATGKENAADLRAHGTHREGERRYNARLTEDAVREIRATYGNVAGATIVTLGRKYGVSSQTIQKAATRRIWKHVP